MTYNMMNSRAHSTVITNPRTLPAWFWSRESNSVKIENVPTSTENENVQPSNVQIMNEVIERVPNVRDNGESSCNPKPIVHTSVCDSSLDNDRISSSETLIQSTISSTVSDSTSSPHSVNDDLMTTVSSSENISIDDISSNNNSEKKTVCPYGSACYRQNPLHRTDFSHPTDDTYEEEVQCTSSSDVNTNKRHCWYGTHCYRKNKEHIEKFDHSFISSGRSKRIRKIRVELACDSDNSEHLEDFSDTDEYEASFIDDDDSDDDSNSEEDALSEISDDSDISGDEENNKRKKKTVKKNNKKKFSPF